MLNEQAGAMIQLAEDNGIPEVWITEMGSGYGASAATEEVSSVPRTQQSPRHVWLRCMTLTFLAPSANLFSGSRAPS